MQYVGLQAGFVVLAFSISGFAGVRLFAFQAFVAVWQLELVNYVEYYRLTRKHLGDGVYEHVLLRHSWNATDQASNRLLINLQRHSDHHYKPDRPYPLLQTYAPEEAPHLAFGYPIMAMMAMFPWRFRRFMNPKVQRWRKMYYPGLRIGPRITGLKIRCRDKKCPTRTAGHKVALGIEMQAQAKLMCSDGFSWGVDAFPSEFVGAEDL